MQDLNDLFYFSIVVEKNGFASKTVLRKNS